MMKKILYAGLLLAFLIPKINFAQSLRNQPFSWDNVTVYFLITDRFYNGDTSNDVNFDRQQDSRNNELDFHGGDIAGVTQKIQEGYFDELGVSAIWVTPVVENRHGFNNPPTDDPAFRDYPYHGYHTNDWTAFDPNFTSAEDFEAFIDEAHNHGIRVLVDIVMNHSGYRTFKNVNGQLEFVDEDFPNDWVRLACGADNGELPCDDLSTPLFGLPDIRTESFNQVALPQWLLDKWDVEGRRQQELDELDAYFARSGKPRTPRYYLIKWLTDWVREYGIDGFRVDTQRHVGLDAWADLKEEADLALREWKQNNPTKKLDDLDFYMTGEDSGLNIKGDVNDPRPDDFSVGKYNSMINFRSPKEAYTEMGQEDIFSSFAAKLNNDGGFDSADEYNMISYLRSHDFSEFYTGNMFYGGTTLMLSPGGVQIYYGDESGREFFNATTYVDAGYRSDMNWDNLDDAMLLHWRKLGRFRREHTSIGAGFHQKLSDTPYAFKREYNRNGESDKALVFQGQDNDFVGALNVFGMWPDGTELKDYFSDKIGVVSGGTVTFGTTFGIVLIGEPFNLSDSVTLSINPNSGTYLGSVEVAIEASSTVQDAEVTIFYTTDGTTPSASSAIYTTPFTIDATTTVNAVAIDNQGNESSLIARDYIISDGGAFDVYFKKPSDWSSAFIYIFDQNTGDAISGFPAWPGVAMDAVNNTPWFKYTIGQNVQVGMVFNDNGGAQTDDLSRISNGWYDNQWFDECPSDCPDDIVSDPYDVYFRKPADWETAFIYLFDQNSGTPISGFPAWPGVPMDDIDNTPWAKYTIDESVEVGIVFNNAAGLQTDDLTRNTEGWYDEQWFDSCPSDCEGDISDTAFDVFFKKPASWNTAFIYIYDKNANAPIPGAPAWPGIAMNLISGSPWYSLSIDESVEVGIVFNDNGGAQTDDLSRTTDGWYDDQWFDVCPSECPDQDAVRAALEIKTSKNLEADFVKTWPNPFKDVLNLSFDTEVTNNSVDVKIYTIAGVKTNISSSMDTRTNKMTINTSSLARGMYLMKVTSNKNTQVIYLVK